MICARFGRGVDLVGEMGLEAQSTQQGIRCCKEFDPILAL